MCPEDCLYRDLTSWGRPTLDPMDWVSSWAERRSSHWNSSLLSTSWLWIQYEQLPVLYYLLFLLCLSGLLFPKNPNPKKKLFFFKLFYVGYLVITRRKVTSGNGIRREGRSWGPTVNVCSGLLKVMINALGLDTRDG